MKQQITLMAALFFAAILSCNKKENKTDPAGQSYRIKEIQSGAETKTFSYDNENRISRINFNGGSYRFTYSPPEITAQVYFSNDTPDPNWKYMFTLTRKSITTGRRYFPNGGVSREYQNEYDNQQRLMTTVMSLKGFTGAEDESHRYEYFYNAQNLLEKVIYTRQIKIGNALVKSDSSSAVITYFDQKSFVNWKQMGFDFFGSATAGIEFQGTDTFPFSFTFLEQIVPADKAVKSIDTKKHKWNQQSNTWSLGSSNTSTFLETDYQYNEAGQLQNYKNNTLKWEAYQ